MTYHTVMDAKTGEVRVIGKDGRQYTTAELEAAQRMAAQGDKAALATLENLERSDFTGADPTALMMQMLHDCPECRAALARGEQPTLGFLPAPKKKSFAAANRWRSRKQRR